MVDMKNEYGPWKDMLRIQQRTQITRVFRVEEAKALIANVDVNDESSFTASRGIPNLKESGVTTEDVQAWLSFLLYSGCRFPEAVYIHNDPALYNNRGIIDMSRLEGKKMRTIKQRSIHMSYEGRKILPSFFNARTLLARNSDETQQTLTSLTTIMRVAGERIKLPTVTLTTYKNAYKKDINGNVLYEEDPKTGKKRKIFEREVKKENTVNGCMVRSMRKTWESWLYNALGDTPRMVSKILLSQGHNSDTQLHHYLNLGYDAEDMAEISKEVEGFGIVG